MKAEAVPRPIPLQRSSTSGDGSIISVSRYPTVDLISSTNSGSPVQVDTVDTVRYPPVLTIYNHIIDHHRSSIDRVIHDWRLDKSEASGLPIEED